MEVKHNIKHVFLLILFFCLISFYGMGQNFTKSTLSILASKEDSLVLLGEKMVNEEEVLERFNAGVYKLQKKNY